MAYKYRFSIPPFPAIGAEIRHCPDLPGYAVSDDGRLWSCRSKSHRKAWRVIGTNRNKDGYFRVGLTGPDGRHINKFVHVLLLEAFVGPRPEGMESLHIDGDRNHNYLSNLRWGTHQDNMKDCIVHGAMNPVRGQASPHAKLTDDDVLMIRRLWKYLTGPEIARLYNIDRTTAHGIATGRDWSHLPLEAVA